VPIPADTRIVFLDLDRTLLDDRLRQSSVEGAIASVARRLGFDPDEAGRQFDDFWRASVTPEMFQAWLRGSLGGRDPLREAWASTLASHGVDDPAEVDAAVAEHLAAQDESWLLYDDVLPFFDEMDAAGIKMGIVTNGHPDLQLRKIRVLGLEPRMASITVSGVHAVPKPDPQIFEYAFDATGLGRVPAVHVGDSLDADVAGALAAGIGAIWLDRDGVRDGDAEPDATIHSLAELPALLAAPQTAERAAARG
jgi:putative hydrolase of the HAD superfamily